ncbi:unnamed protein product [Urochloa humidicola]
MKVMDKALLESQRKLCRAQTDREILQLLDHPFLPTLYAHFESDRFACLIMEFCPGDDLHALRQRQPGKHFPEHAARSAPCAGIPAHARSGLQRPEARERTHQGGRPHHALGL